jgi:aminopeptidase N
MSKYLFIVLLLMTLHASSQNPTNRNNVNKIARSERQAHSKKISESITLASGNFTVYYYKCEWQIDPSKNYIRGKVTPYFIITAPTDSLVFDLSHVLKVDSVHMRAKKLRFSQSANETLAIRFDKTYSVDERDSLSIFYQGVPAGGGFGSFVQSDHNGTPVIWTLSEPYGAKDWWPCRNGLDDKADSIDIYVTHPSAYAVSSNGVLQGVIKHRGNTTTFYKHRYPIASYLVAIAVTDYSVFTDSVQLGNKSLPVISYVYPEDAETFHSNTYRMLNAMRLYNEKFTEYPFINERYGQTQFGWGGGMENQTNAFISSSDEHLMAHELAHQWFGDKITCGSWTDIWLNEGFATFCADFLYFETFNADEYKIAVKSNLDNIVRFPGGAVKVDDTTSTSRIFDGRLSYSKGAFLLRMLRWTLGDSLFFKGIRDYLNDPLLKYNFARTADLQRNFESASGLDLSYFFNQWYSGEGYPSFNVQWSLDANNKATITIDQTTSVPSSVSFFRVPLALSFKNSTQEKTIVVQNDVKNQVVTADIGFKADTVLIDPEHYLISNNNKSLHTKPIEPEIESVTVSPNPFTDKININFKQAEGKKILVQLYDNFAHFIVNDKFTGISSNQTYTLTAPNLAAGTYLLRITFDGKVTTRYMVKTTK